MTAFVVLGVALGATIGLSLWLCHWGSRLREDLVAAETQAAGAAREAAGLRRDLAQHQAVRRFLAQGLREFPHLARELHGGVPERRIPGNLLTMLVRLFDPKQAVVLVRRRPAETDPARASRLVVAAASPEDSTVRRGTELGLGEGELGFVAEVQRVMDRAELDEQTQRTRGRLTRGALPGFSPDLAAPMVFGEQTLGVIAVAGPSSSCPEAKDVLRLVAQVGASALRSAAAYSEMKTSADVDGLTGILNKRRMTEILAEGLLSARDRIAPFAVFLFDIDHFKHYNDTHGHVAGDRLLRALARLVEENTRKENAFGRFGGEEFLILFPGATRAQALAAADKIRSVVAAHSFPHGSDQPLGALTVSGGVSAYPDDGLDATSLLKSADEALYAAKRGGRNLVLPAVTRYLGDAATEPVQEKAQ